MKRFLPAFVLSLGWVVACTTASTPPASPVAGSAPVSKPVVTPAAPAPTPSAVNRKVEPAAESEFVETERQREIRVLSEKLAGRTREDNEKPVSDIVIDPKTGQRQQRVTKSSQYYVVRDRLYSSLVRDNMGFPVLRQDEGAWYIEAPPERAGGAPRSVAAKSADEEIQNLIVDIPVEEAEATAPSPSKLRLRLVEASEGLPTSGMWRENFAVADMDGDGRPEIIAPPPRLSGKEIQIFKWNGQKWVSQVVKFDNPEKIDFEYGGVVAGDMDGDGRNDIVFGKHGGGPAIAFNKGGNTFRIETRGLPKSMTTRVMSLGDLDGDGKLDVLALSDEPEYVMVRTAESEGNTSVRQPHPDGFIAGYDTRGFLSRDGKYVEVHDGLDESCFGYTLGLFAPAPDGKAPFYASSCRYQGDAQVIYTYDKTAQRFQPAGDKITERHSLHIGTAMGLYRGHPAAFMTYVKNGPQGSSRNISGDGLSIYYREGDDWKRKRVLKRIEKPVMSQGIAVGDLNGDGLDDIVLADDSLHRLRVFFQRPNGEFEEMSSELEPSYPNHATAVRLADLDGDGRLDIFVMFQFLTGDETRAGGLKFFRNLP